MSSLLEQISALNDMIIQGENLDAFEKFYSDDIIIQENDEKLTIGKEANRKKRTEFVNSILEMHAARPLNVAIGEGVTMVRWYLDYTHKEWGAMKYTQVAVQEWKDGLIVKEQYLYNKKQDT